MAVTLQKLCEQSNYLYGMRVLAGENRMMNVVQWVHTIEDAEASGFLHGGELIFTTGIAQKKGHWLLPFIESLKEKKASGLVVNYGPYIERVPQEAIDYCNEIGFPLLDVPWKTRLVDITRDFCNQIIQEERESAEVGTTFLRMIQFPYEVEKCIAVLEQYQFVREDRYCVIGIDYQKCEQEKELPAVLDAKIYLELERILQKGSAKYCYFKKELDKRTLLVLEDYSHDEIKEIVNQLQKMGEKSCYFEKIYIAVGANENGLETIAKNYHKISMVLNLAKTKNKSPLSYDEFGLKKVLISVEEKDVLKEYYQSILGKLERFDQKNDTKYLLLLRKYLDYDGSVQRVADDTEVHRNTVNYQLNKIKKILGNELSTLQERFQIMLAFQIKDVL